MKKIKTWLNFKDFAKDYEVNTMPSETVPDQTMSVSEILNRYARGLPIGGSKVPIYEDDNDLPDPRTLDLAERQELKEQYTTEIQKIRTKRPIAPKQTEVEKTENGTNIP